MDDQRQQQPATERRNPRSELIDRMSAYEIAETINREDLAVQSAVESALAEIASVIEAVADAFRNDGRLVYVGAGTSGRLAVLDAAECPPTFGTPPEQVVALMAGGGRAVCQAIEAAEDEPVTGAADIRNIDVTERDVVIGVSASGRTPYVIGALAEAAQRGARTALVTAADPRTCTVQAGTVVALSVGPEVIAGSTRMKAGSATKMVLNMISTGAMVLTGRVYRNMMIDVKPNSEKLRRRAVRIVCDAAGVDEPTATRLIDDVNGNVKLAVVIAKTGLDREDAQCLLDKEQGVVYRAIEKEQLCGGVQAVSGQPGDKMCRDGHGADSPCNSPVGSVGGLQGDSSDQAGGCDQDTE